MPMTRARRLVGEPEPADVAPICGRGRARGRVRGLGRARGAAPPRGQARAASLEPEYESEGSTDPVPPLSAPDAMPSVQELLLRVLARLEGASPTPVILDALAPTVSVGPYTTSVDPPMIHVGPSSASVDPPMASVIPSQTSRPSTGSQLLGLSIAPSIAPLKFMVPPASASPATSTVEQKSFERFVRLAPPKFDGTLGDRAYDFLSECQDLLCNLTILETHGVAYTSYQFTGLAKEWWRSVLACRPVGSLAMTWEQFTEVFLEKFVPYSLRDSRRDEFDQLQQGSMSVSEYEARFYELSKYALSSIPTEFERIQRFAKGLAGYLQEATTSLVLAGGTFQSVVDHARMIEHIRHDRQGGGKRFRQHGQFSGHQPRDREFQIQGHQGRAGCGFSRQSSQGRDPRACYVCDEIGHLAKHCPHRAPFAQSSGTQPARPALAPAARDTSQGMTGGTRGGRGTVRGGSRGDPQSSGGRKVCYAVPDQVEAYDVVITDRAQGLPRSS